MKIHLNGKLIKTEANNLNELLCERQIDVSYIAAAFNGTFIPKNQYDNKIMQEGCYIEILSVMQGG